MQLRRIMFYLKIERRLMCEVKLCYMSNYVMLCVVGEGKDDTTWVSKKPENIRDIYVG